MCKAIVAGKVRKVFGELSNGNAELLLGGLAPGAVHSMDGEHALSGTRLTPEEIREWYVRLLRIFPDLSFTVSEVVVKGWPGRRSLSLHGPIVPPRTGFPTRTGVSTSLSRGINVIELAWGQVTAVHIHADSQAMAAALAVAAARVPEAAAPAIVS